MDHLSRGDDALWPWQASGNRYADRGVGSVVPGACALMFWATTGGPRRDDAGMAIDPRWTTVIRECVVTAWSSQ